MTKGVSVHIAWISATGRQAVLILVWVLQWFLNMHVFDNVRCQEATWTDLEPILGGQEAPKWSGRRVKTGVELSGVKLSEVKLS